MTDVIATWTGNNDGAADLLEMLDRVETGKFTTDHAASSHGIPVLVRDSGEALGANDVHGKVIDVGELYERLTDEQYALIEQARRAGYKIRLANQPWLEPR